MAIQPQPSQGQSQTPEQLAIPVAAPALKNADKDQAGAVKRKIVKHDPLANVLEDDPDDPLLPDSKCKGVPAGGSRKAADPTPKQPEVAPPLHVLPEATNKDKEIAQMAAQAELSLGQHEEKTQPPEPKASPCAKRRKTP